MGIISSTTKSIRHIWNAHGSSILTGSSWFLTGVATITAYRAGKREGVNPSKTPKEWLLNVAVPAGATVGSIVCSGASHYKDAGTIAALAAESVFNEKKRKQMMQDVEDFVGKENMDKLRKNMHPEPVIPHDIPENKFLWIDDTTGARTIASVSEILEAEYTANRQMKLRGYISFGEWLSLANFNRFKKGELALTEDAWGNPVSDCSDEDLGWCDYAESTYGYQWIDFKHILCHDKEGSPYYIIDYPFAPHADYISM